MEALGAASAVISVTQLTGKVISIIYEYQRGARHASKQINAVKRELQQLRGVLECLEDLASDDENKSASFDAIADPLQACKVELERLESVLTSEKGRFSRLGQALKWPLKEKEVKECLDILAGQRSVLQLALTADQSTVMLAIRDGVTKSNRQVSNLNDRFKSFTIDDYREKIVNWLNAPDPSLNHNKACQARQPKTGLWLLASREYQKWKTETDRILWLHGIPGCGKTILSSTVIEDVASLRRSRPKSLLLYYYFDFNDTQKQEVDMFLRSMVSQIVWQQERVSASLRGLYERYDRGARQPARELLLTTLKDNLRDSAETFMVLDALDECEELQPLLNVISTISERQIPTLHIACTSRRERHIVEVFDRLNVIETSIQNEQVDADIGLLVDDQLEHDPQLRKWSMDIKDEIKTALARGSQGMFRWAVCQMDSLKNCLKPVTLRRALRSLPKTLDETYARILENVKEDHLEDVLKMLRWLIYAKRPLTLGELAEAVAISVDDTPVFDPENRLRHPVDSLHLCSTLVSFTSVALYGGAEENPVHCVVRLAHFSVQEHLLSNSVVSDSRISLSFEQSTAQAYIGKACLTYLLYLDEVLIGKQQFSRKAVEKDYALYEYSAVHWDDHATTTDAITRNLVERLFCSETAFIVWTHGSNRAFLYTKADKHRLKDLDDDGEDIDNDKDIAYLDQRYYGPRTASSHDCKALYVASYLGFTGLVEELVDHVEDMSLEVGFSGTALGAAASEGHTDVLRVLLEHGARPDLEFEHDHIDPFRTSLFAAVRHGRVECTRLLIAAGSCVNQKWSPSGGNALVVYGRPLWLAAATGDTDMIQVLIEEGAEVNAMNQGIYTSVPLCMAARHGHADAVRLLLANDAIVNCIDEEDRPTRGNHMPLFYAITYESPEVAEILILNGADVNVKTRYEQYGVTTIFTPLLVAVDYLGSGQRSIYGNRRKDMYGSRRKDNVRLLLENGADVNIEVRDIDSEDPAIITTPLLVAVTGGYQELVQMLLANGADVEVKGEHGNARETALHNGHDDIAALLPFPD